MDQKDIVGPDFENKKIIRRGIVPVFLTPHNTYLLLIKSSSRDEFEIPGGEAKVGSGDTLRELQEETGLPSSIFHATLLNLHRIHKFPIIVSGGSHKKLNIQNIFYQAITKVKQLPEIILSKEHKDFLFIKLNQTDERDYWWNLRLQCISEKLLVTNTDAQNHTAEFRNIESEIQANTQRIPISQITSQALQYWASIDSYMLNE